MNYQQAVEFLTERKNAGIKLGLARVRKAARELGSPHLTFPSILVAGTNGKGSTTRWIASFLGAKGKKAGAYYSPHLVEYMERISIGNAQIPRADFAGMLTDMLDTGVHEKHSLTEFEIITLLALQYFAREQVDIAVLEVGLGGLYDATNIVPAECAVITRIGYDHQELLGTTLSRIATQKAGIIKNGKPLFTIEQEDEVAGILAQEASARYAEIHNVKKDKRTADIPEYQRQNASLALAVCGYILGRRSRLTGKEVAAVAASFSFEGRYEHMSAEPLVILDGAHNENALRHLMTSLIKDYPERKFRCLVAILRRKDYQSCISELLSHAAALSGIVFTTVPDEPCWDAASLKAYADGQQAPMPTTVLEPPEEALVQTLKSLRNNEGCLCAGSFYLIGYLRRTCFMRNSFGSISDEQRQAEQKSL